MKKSIFKYFIFMIAALFTFCFTIKADLIDYSGGTAGSSGSIGSGSWSPSYVGVKVSIVNSSNTVEDVEIFVNSSGKAGKFSYENLPKTKQNYNITWVDSSSRKVYTNDSLPSSWRSNNKNINIYNYLEKNNYSLLINLIETEGAFNTLSPGDYILVEPMVYIGGYYGTGFELGRAFFKINSCTKNTFCYNYGRSVFGGSSTNTGGGLFYTTLYVSSYIPEVGIRNMKNWLEKFPDSNTGSTYEKRHKCIMAKSCGRGIGVFKYDEIYRGSLTIEKVDSNTKAKLSGAGFTLYSDSSCSKKIKNEQTTNSNGQVTFKNLATGKYYYKETKVPSGYTGDSNCRLANVTNGSTTTITVNNVKNATEGTLKIYIKNNVTKQIITSATSQAKFDIYKGANCSGTKVTSANTSSGFATINNLDVGTYSIKEVSAPSGYEPKVNKCVKTSVSIVANSTTEEVIFYEPTCTTKLYESDKSVTSLLQLYNEYGHTGLLDFRPGKAVCDDADCSSTDPSVGCLSGAKSMVEFNETNLSCFSGEPIKDIYGKPIAFCSDSFNLTNNLGQNHFYNKSGQFLIKQTESDSIQFYKDENNLVEIRNPYVATANVSKICYAIAGNTLVPTQIEVPSLEVYFGDNNIYDTIKYEKLSSEKNTSYNSNRTSNGFIKYSYNETYNFNLNVVYLQRMTGKVTENQRGTLEGVGIVSRFDTTSDTIPFKLKYGDSSFVSNSCTYGSNPEIIEYPPDTPNGEIALEFRIINLEKPFLNEKGEVRKTNSNWCDYTALEGDKCSATNNVVVTNIINAPDSYGRNTTNPLYKITLTSSDIKKIREYNMENSYDNYELYCNVHGECSNAFIMDLKNQTLNRYEEDRVLKNYGTISELIYTPGT